MQRLVTDGKRVDWSPDVPIWFETYLHGHVIVVWDPLFQLQVSVEGGGKKPRKIRRDLRIACSQLEHYRRFIMNGGKRRKLH